MKKLYLIVFSLFLFTSLFAEKNYIILNNGKTKKKIYYQNDLVAKIGKQNSSVSFNKIKSNSKKIPTTSSSIKTINKEELPVFTNRAGSKIVPTGNIIIQLNKNTNSKKWAKKHNLTIIKTISNRNNIILVKSDPGMKSIELSNKLAEKKEIIYISPNMWSQVQAR